MANNRETKRVRISIIIYAVLAILFALCIVAQVFFAGLAIFVDAANWAKHVSFVHLFEFIPILMLIMAFVGQLPRWARWQSAGLFGLVFIMYFTANATSLSPAAAAVHPVIAMVIFWMSIVLVRKSWHLALLD